MSRISWSAVALVLALISVGAFAVWVATRPLPVPSRSANSSYIEPRDKPDPPVMVVFGDSFGGVDEGPYGPAWPELIGDRLGWVVFNESSPDSGFIADSSEGTFTDRLTDLDQYAADLIVIEGGASDLGLSPKRAGAAAAEVIEQISTAHPKAALVVISPFAAGRPGPEVRALRDRLRQVASAEDVEFIDVSGMLTVKQVSADGRQPTEIGHRTITNRLAPRLSGVMKTVTAGR